MAGTEKVVWVPTWRAEAQCCPLQDPTPSPGLCSGCGAVGTVGGSPQCQSLEGALADKPEAPASKAGAKAECSWESERRRNESEGLPPRSSLAQDPHPLSRGVLTKAVQGNQGARATGSAGETQGPVFLLLPWPGGRDWVSGSITPSTPEPGQQGVGRGRREELHGHSAHLMVRLDPAGPTSAPAAH